MGYVEDIKLSSNNLLVIINDILDISKIESGKMELVPGNYYISHLIKDVSLIIETQTEQKGFEFDRIFDILEDLEDCVLKSSDKELFDSIRNAMKNLDVDTVKMIINEYFH